MFQNSYSWAQLFLLFLVVKYAELCDLAVEAANNDGRLARRPLRNGSQEILAHQLLLSQMTQLTEEYNASIKVDTGKPFTHWLVEATSLNFRKELEHWTVLSYQVYCELEIHE